MACSTVDPAQVDARRLYREGKIEESLTRLKGALADKPTNPELRVMYLTYREQAIVTWLNHGTAARENGDPRTATSYYRRVLSVDPENTVARSGIRALERAEKHARLLQDAEAFIRKQDEEGARSALRTVLSEDPGNAVALRLWSGLEDKATKNSADPQLSASLKRPLSIDFKDAPLKQVFEVFSRTSGINFVFDRDVKGDQKTTVFLRGTTVKDAMEVVLLTNQLERRVLDGNTLLIYPNTPAKTKDYQPLAVRSFFLANADAEQVAGTLKALLRSRDVVVDKKQNMVLMRDTSEAIRAAEKIVALHDLPEPEVMLEVEILEVNRTRLTELGIKFPEQLSLVPLPATSGGSVTLSDILHLTPQGVSATLSPTNVNARGVDGDINLLANPRIRARNRETAKILIGDRVPNITTTSTATGFVAQSVQYLDVGLKLEVTPVISIDNEIAIKVALEVSSISNQVTTSSGTLAYQIGTRTASTVLRLKDGENQVLAGLINDEDRRTTNKLPGFGDIPLVGKLFSSSLSQTAKNEIVLSITPRLVRSMPRPDLTKMEFAAGTESSLRGLSSRGTNEAPISGGGLPSSTATLAVATSNENEKVKGQPQQGLPRAASGALPVALADGGTSANGDTGAGVMRWQAPSSVKVGESFSAQLWMQPAQPLTSVPYVLSFDPKSLQILSVAEGDLMKQAGGASVFNQRVDQKAGQVLVTNTRSQGSQGDDSGASGPGVLVTLSLRALTPTDDTQLQLITIAPVGLNGATVSITPPPPQAIKIDP
ncbi:secretin and TonB N-terminal domain-containing protein [Cupriavidus sp. USMAA2-4]|uniref:secretin and TonB N-terminal domain-containing protein n=1 Tax=Cupriavidus sp. USMAA2-4 TaxID=876364 RepID=UPI000B1A918E|nr:secretin and TonB N-terminal domain-containing protein [Cupriavidus sp. USMAA2-4]